MAWFNLILVRKEDLCILIADTISAMFSNIANKHLLKSFIFFHLYQLKQPSRDDN